MGKFPSHNFHLIVGKFTQDTGDSAASPPPSTVTADAAHVVEKFLNYMKFIGNWEKMVHIAFGALV
jgi:hypothetical protein